MRRRARITTIPRPTPHTQNSLPISVFRIRSRGRVPSPGTRMISPELSRQRVAAWAGESIAARYGSLNRASRLLPSLPHLSDLIPVGDV